jgi:2-keto-3-deoxygluconate permease
MKIYQSITRVPGGMMVVPLFIGMVLNTFFPTLMQIGGFTQALTGVGYPTLLGMYLFTVGTKMTVRTAPRMLARGLGIMAAKVGTATIFALVIAHVFDGNVLGLSTLAVMVAMSDTNGGMFLALMSVMGSKEDAGTYVIQSIETGPFLTMLIFVGAGLAVIPWLTMVSVIAPIVVGAILGNLDDDLKAFFSAHEPIIIPFMAFTLGQTINLRAVVTAGIPGVVLGLTVVCVTGVVCIASDRLLGGSGIAGAAASSTAGNSAAVPQAVALADPSYASIAPAATVQVAASVIVTAVLTPFLASWWFKRTKRQGIAALERREPIELIEPVEPIQPIEPLIR